MAYGGSYHHWKSSLLDTGYGDSFNYKAMQCWIIFLLKITESICYRNLVDSTVVSTFFYHEVCYAFWKEYNILTAVLTVLCFSVLLQVSDMSNCLTCIPVKKNMCAKCIL